MTKLELHGIKNKLVKSCSGGMKRKLSLAVALLGDPAVVLLVSYREGYVVSLLYNA